jgi:hypothetical protein
MASKEASQLVAGISGRSGHRSFKFVRHQVPGISPLAATTDFRFKEYLSIIMHKYSSSVTGPAALSSPKTVRAGFSDDYKKKFLLDSVK